MKRLLVIFVCIFAFIGFVDAAEIVRLPLGSNLVDKKSGITGGGLQRDSAATYIDTGGILQTSYGTRENLVTDPFDFTQAAWNLTNASGNASVDSASTVTLDTTDSISQSIAGITTGTTYILSAKIRKLSGVGTALNVTFYDGASFIINPSSITITSEWQTFYWYATSTNTAAGSVKVWGRSAGLIQVEFDGIQLEALPSGNVIGDDLFDQEELNGEELTNGNFSDATSTDSSVSPLAGWSNAYTHNATNKFTISSGQCTLISDGTLTQIGQNNILTPGTLYRFSIDIISISANSITLVNWAGATYKSFTSTGNNQAYYFFATDAGIGLKRGGATTVVFDNVSLTAVT
ncbi:MAG: hypothetical protein KJP23_10495, partial [Deltaproteobacteria bacterium]|nr:hypothetical protein [Deltaproteobacteria bacterium]